jgi:hypothetical protein
LGRHLRIVAAVWKRMHAHVLLHASAGRSDLAGLTT